MWDNLGGTHLKVYIRCPEVAQPLPGCISEHPFRHEELEAKVRGDYVEGILQAFRAYSPATQAKPLTLNEKWKPSDT